MPSWNSRSRRHGGQQAIDRKRFEQTKLLAESMARLALTPDQKSVVEASIEFLRDNPKRVLNGATEDYLGFPQLREEIAEEETPIAEPEVVTVCTHGPGSGTCPCCTIAPGDTTSPQAIAKQAFQSLLEPEPGYSYDDEVGDGRLAAAPTDEEEPAT